MNSKLHFYWKWSGNYLEITFVVKWSITSNVKVTQTHHCFDSPDSKLYLSPQYVDIVGFSVFLKTYLEVEDFPADFCQRLFRYFQHVDQDGCTKSSVPKGGKSSWSSLTSQCWEGKLYSHVQCSWGCITENNQRRKGCYREYFLLDSLSHTHLFVSAASQEWSRRRRGDYCTCSNNMRKYLLLWFYCCSCIFLSQTGKKTCFYRPQ